MTATKKNIGKLIMTQITARSFSRKKSQPQNHKCVLQNGNSLQLIANEINRKMSERDW